MIDLRQRRATFAWDVARCFLRRRLASLFWIHHSLTKLSIDFSSCASPGRGRRQSNRERFGGSPTDDKLAFIVHCSRVLSSAAQLAYLLLLMRLHNKRLHYSPPRRPQWNKTASIVNGVWAPLACGRSRRVPAPVCVAALQRRDFSSGYYRRCRGRK
jgi:hypothetical protein